MLLSLKPFDEEVAIAPCPYCGAAVGDVLIENDDADLEPLRPLAVMPRSRTFTLTPCEHTVREVQCTQDLQHGDGLNRITFPDYNQR